jgi:methylenetetrahydrofolate reductase (NADPH)
MRGDPGPMTSFKEALESGRFLVTVEASPPKGVRLEGFLKSLESLSGVVDAVNLPDGRSARIHLGSLGACMAARDRGLEPIFTLSCRDRNRVAICADLLSAHSMGIRNVLCVSGDYFTFGDAPDAKPVYDLDSVQALQLIRLLETGKDIGGNDLDGAPAFCAGCVANPQAAPMAPHLLKLEKKLAAGAEFIQTLDIHEFERAIPFLERLRGRPVRVLAGIRLVTDREVALWEAGKMPGNALPGPWVEEIKGATDPSEILRKAKARMADMVRQVRASGLCDGVHLTLEGHEHLLTEILQEAGVM